VILAHDIQDDGFHEIQLNGKQLVFLFMAATVVSVVIFLCGVLVGRGVRTERAAVEVSAPNGALAEVTPQPASVAPPAAGSDPTRASEPSPAGEDPTEPLKPKAAAPAPAHAPAPVEKPVEKRAEKTVEKPVEAPAPKPVGKPSEKVADKHEKSADRHDKSAEKPAATAGATTNAETHAGDPAGQGFAVQIAALNIRSEADAIAKRLTSKGYSAYVLAPADGTPSVFRVRVGKFPTRREAESIAAKLQKEEQFKPWVTR
jgi:DedD protein